MISLLDLGQESLDPESLARRHGEKQSQVYGAQWCRKGEEEEVLTGRTGFENLFLKIFYLFLSFCLSMLTVGGGGHLCAMV